MQDFLIPSFTTQDLLQIQTIPSDKELLPLEEETFFQVLGDLLEPAIEEAEILPLDNQKVTKKEQINVALEEIEGVEEDEEEEEEIAFALIDNYPQVWSQVTNAPKLFKQLEKEALETPTPLKTSSQKSDKPVISTNTMLKPEVLAFVAEIPPEVDEVEAVAVKSSFLEGEILSSANVKNEDIKRIEKGITENKPEFNVTSLNTIMNNVNSTLKPAPVYAIPIAIDTPDWGKAFNQQIIWLGQQGIKSAQIKINPEALGPLNIHLTMNQKEASLHIVSISAEVCELIGHAMPELKERMQEQGLQLSEVNIESQADSSQKHAHNHSAKNPTMQAKPEVVDKAIASSVISNNVGIIDYFA
jgi:flagellar hook-length control protein FliK